jgi:hypothetical protein
VLTGLLLAAASASCISRPPVTPPAVVPLAATRGTNASQRCGEGLALAPMFGTRPQPARSSGDGGQAFCVDGGCWFWAGVGDGRRASGGAARISVHAPRTSPRSHVLAEIAIQGQPASLDAIEVGWIISPPRFGDSRPRLFVHRWLDGQGCWEDCGFQPWSARLAPGDPLDDWVGQSAAMGIVLFERRWWVFVEGEWLGFFDASDWRGRLDGAAALQWYGEVFTPDLPPRLPMGNGLPASDKGAARFDEVCDVPPAGGRCEARARRFGRATEARFYGLVSESGSAFRYGGPGAPVEVTPPRPPSSASGGTPGATETSGASPPR